MVGKEIFEKYGSLIVEKTDGFHAYPASPLSTEDRLQVVTLGWTFINDLYAIYKKVSEEYSKANSFYASPGVSASGMELYPSEYLSLEHSLYDDDEDEN